VAEDLAEDGQEHIAESGVDRIEKIEVSCFSGWWGGGRSDTKKSDREQSVRQGPPSRKGRRGHCRRKKNKQKQIRVGRGVGLEKKREKLG